MKSSVIVRVLGAAVLSTGLLTPGLAAAQVVGPADAGRIGQPEYLERQPAAPPQAIQTPQIPTVQAPAGAENVTFNLTGISYDGMTVYAPADLAPLHASRINQKISLADVYAMAAELTTKYRNDGYILTQVVVPPQTIENGAVHLQVIEGFIDNVVVEGELTPAERHLVASYAEKVEGSPLNTRALERAVLLINDLPGLSVRGILSPAASTQGASDLRVVVERKAYDAEIGIDNFGSLYLGRLEGYMAASANSLLGRNERISGTLVYAPDEGLKKEIAYGDITYAQPFGPYGTRVELNGSVASTNPGYDLAQFRINGQSVFLSAKIVQPIVRTRAFNWSVYGTFDWRSVNTQSNIEDTRRDRIAALRFGTKIDRLDSILGGGYNTASVEVARGLSILNASDKGDANLSRTEGNPEFTKIEAEIQRLQRLGNYFNLLIAAKGQLANDAMLSSEEFGVGGNGYGRGYDSSEILGDSGIAGKMELQLTNPVEFAPVRTWQVYTFIDGGRVWNRDATAASDKVISLSSTGLGVRATLPSETRMGAYVALPLNRDVQTEGNQAPRFYFNLSQSF